MKEIDKESVKVYVRLDQVKIGGKSNHAVGG